MKKTNNFKKNHPINFISDSQINKIEYSNYLGNRDSKIKLRNSNPNTSKFNSGVKKKAFTLVELIATISIIAVLSIVIFLNFQKWISNSRDSKRLSAINQIHKSLEIGYIETASYPIPDRNQQNRIHVWTIDNTELFYQWVIGKWVIQNLDSIGELPQDPLQKKQNIVYSVSANQQSYQIAMTMEKNEKQAVLAGNYDCFLFYQTGGNTYVTNPPSLIYNYSGYNNSEHDIQDNQMYYINDKWHNLPYSLDDKNTNNIAVGEIFDNSNCAGPYITGVNIATHEKIWDVSIQDIQSKWIINHPLNLIKTIKHYSKINDVLGNFDETLKYGDKFGASVASMWDLDGDGIVDIAVGTYSKNYEETNDGIIYILFLDQEWMTKTFTRISLPGEINEWDMFGVSVANIGDINGDGTNDIVVWSPMNDDGGTDRWAVYIIYMNSDGTMQDWKKINYNSVGFTRQLADRDNFGGSVAGLGDLDWDGIKEIAIGATEDDDGGINHWAVYIFFLNSEGGIKKYQKISETRGGFWKELFYGDRFGNSISGVGDLNWDGVEDLAVGAYQCNDGGIDKGCVYLLYLDNDAKVKSYSTISDVYGWFDWILTWDDMFGSSIAWIGDLNWDGMQDIAVGAIWDDEDGEDSGTIYILYLDWNGAVKKYKKIGNKAWTFNSRLDEKDYFGVSIASLWDLDGDGLVELLVWATWDDDRWGNHGSVYVLFLEL